MSENIVASLWVGTNDALLLVELTRQGVYSLCLYTLLRVAPSSST